MAARVVEPPPNAIKKAVKKAPVPVPVFGESDAAPFFAPVESVLVLLVESVLVLLVEPVAVPAVAYTPTPDEDLISADGS